MYWLRSNLNCNGNRRIKVRGITRLDGVRGKKQVWRPHVRTWDILQVNIVYWRKCLWHCCDVSATLQSFGAPIVTERLGNCAPLAALVMPLVKVVLRTACIKNGKLKIIKTRNGCQYVGYLSLQLILKMDRTKPSTGPRVGHSCFKRTCRGIEINFL